MSIGREISLTEEDAGGWSAIGEETDIASQGETREEALATIDEAIVLTFGAREPTRMPQSRTRPDSRDERSATGLLRRGHRERPDAVGYNYAKTLHTPGVEIHHATIVDSIIIPLHDHIKIGTLQSIADQCGAVEFDAWCR